MLHRTLLLSLILLVATDSAERVVHASYVPNARYSIEAGSFGVYQIQLSKWFAVRMKSYFNSSALCARLAK